MKCTEKALSIADIVRLEEGDLRKMDAAHDPNFTRAEKYIIIMIEEVSK